PSPPRTPTPPACRSGPTPPGPTRSSRRPPSRPAGRSPPARHERTWRLPPLLRASREEAGLTQRALGKRLKRPQSWVHHCESGNRRVDVAEFVAWARACGAEPEAAFARFLALL